MAVLASKKEVTTRIAYRMIRSTTPASTWKVHVRDDDEDEDASRMIVRINHGAGDDDDDEEEEEEGT